MKLESTTQKLGHIGGRVFLATTTTIAAIAGLLGLMYLAMFTEYRYTRDFAFEASIAVPLDTVPNIHGTIGESTVRYSTVLIESNEALLGARTAAAVSEGLYFLLFIFGCISVILICRRLWKNKPFTVLAQWSLMGLGTLAAVTALLSPWLKDLSSHLAAVALGFPNNGQNVQDYSDGSSWITTFAEFSFQDANHALLALGIVLVLLSLIFRRGTAMQDDADGLV